MNPQRRRRKNERHRARRWHERNQRVLRHLRLRVAGYEAAGVAVSFVRGRWHPPHSLTISVTQPPITYVSVMVNFVLGDAEVPT